MARNREKRIGMLCAGRLCVAENAHRDVLGRLGGADASTDQDVIEPKGFGIQDFATN